MDWVFLQTKQQESLSPSSLPYFISGPSNLQSNSFNSNDKISPSILLIIIILAIIFFISGLLHLLVRFLLRPPNRDPPDLDNVTALQGQLQQLFNLHDHGVDQSFIDTLPVFTYKAIIGLKDPFDCAVCLCEFEAEDKLRLLPKCSHAFHMECIDTWLLSHSTCPLCRSALVPDFSPNTNCSPIVLVLESGSDSSREIISDREAYFSTNSHLSGNGNDELGSSQRKSCEIPPKDELAVVSDSQEKVFPVKLGKFRNVDEGGEGSSSTSDGKNTNNNIDSRRCFSMGSFAYIMDENSSLKVRATPMKKQSNQKPFSGQRRVMSECDCDSRREFHGLEGIKSNEFNGGSSSSISRRESFSISKIWLRTKEKVTSDSSRRAFSFRFPVNRNSAAPPQDLKGKNKRTDSDIEIGRWENGGSELGLGDESEIQSCNSLDFQANPPSFARRTLLWLVGRQNKVVHPNSPPNL